MANPWTTFAFACDSVVNLEKIDVQCGDEGMATWSTAAGVSQCMTCLSDDDFGTWSSDISSALGTRSPTAARIPSVADEKEAQAYLSAGSFLHDLGMCSPCLLMQQPGGCPKGHECAKCHICGNAARAASDSSKPFISTMSSREFEQGGNLASLPSVGSADHANGNCKPCAWFFKIGSCKNGENCRHCHLCDSGEIQRRKKEKLLRMRTARERTQDDKTCHVDVVAAETVQNLFGNNGIAETRTQSDIIVDVDSGINVDLVAVQRLQGVSGDQHVEDVPPCPDMTADVDSEINVDFVAGQTLQDVSGGHDNDEAKASANLIGDATDSGNESVSGVEGSVKGSNLPSIGASKHGSGECKPCAWFFKPDGCVNGKQCRHCHLCPEGEIKRRKKTKAANLRSATRAEPETTNATTRQDIGVLSVLASPDGKCRPCAWVHKMPNGCRNGKDCMHCHSCPEGAIQQRRKVKNMLLRSGAVVLESPPGL